MASKAFGLAQLGNAYSDGALSSRNLIINGAMQVAQRGTSVTGITTSSGYVTVDRFYLNTVIGTLTAEQSTDAPDGFGNSFKVSCTTAESTGSLGSGDYIQISHRIEGQNLQQLGFGTANAKPMTLSFWVKSNKTGTATVELQQKDNSDRQVTPSYTINSADTWEYKTISIPADTSGVINNDNGVGMWVLFWLQSGSAFTGGTNQTSWTTESNPDRNASNLEFATSTSDYFAITGVQLEVGDTATPFEHRSYGEELALCQRYYYTHRYNGTGGHAYTVQFMGYDADDAMGMVNLPVPMRATPTLNYSGTFMRYGGSLMETAAHTVVVYNYTANNNVTNYTLNYDNATNAFSGHTGGAMFWGLQGDSTDNYIEFDAEL